MTLLEARIPEAGYGKKVVVRNVTLKVDQGEIVGLIGPNGAGKSTILKVLIGLLDAPGSNTIFAGTRITGRRPEENVRGGISFVPQGNRVFTELTVRENLEIGGYLLRTTEVQKRMDEVLSIFGELSPFLKRNAGTLSGGEKQQLALANALMLRPKLLLMDEPSLGLAPKLVSQALDTIRRINREYGTTVIIVEQKVHELMKIASRIYALRMGEIVFDGTPSELQDGERLKRIFLV